jgi:hypothetical protein
MAKRKKVIGRGKLKRDHKQKTTTGQAKVQEIEVGQTETPSVKEPVVESVNESPEEKPLSNEEIAELPEYMQDFEPTSEPEPEHEVYIPAILQNKTKARPKFIPTSGADAQPNIEAWRREVDRFLKVGGVGIRINTKAFHTHQQALWVTLYNSIMNTAIENIDALFDAVINDFITHKEGIFSPGYIFRCIINFKTGESYIDEYAVYLYSLLMVHATKDDEVRANSVVDINKAVNEAPDEMAAKILAYFNKIGTPAGGTPTGGVRSM